MKKTFIALLITIVLLVAVASPAAAYSHQAHGSHGKGWVNQNFNGIEDPPPWDAPPGLNR